MRVIVFGYEGKVGSVIAAGLGSAGHEILGVEVGDDVPEGADVVGTVVNGEVKSTTAWKVNYTYKLDNANDVPPTTVKYAGAGKI